MKMAKKVMSVILAVIMALSCFAVVGTAAGASDATHNASVSVKGAVGSITWTSNTKWTLNNPGADDASNEIYAEKGDVVYAYVYCTADYYVKSLQAALFYPSVFLSPNEAMQKALNSTKNITDKNIKDKINIINSDCRLVEALGTTAYGQCSWTNQKDGANVAKFWPTDDSGNLMPEFANLNDWKFATFTIALTADSGGCDEDEDGNPIGCMPDEDDDYIIMFPITIPTDCPDGVYKIGIPENSHARRTKPLGSLQITEMGPSEATGTLDGIIDSGSIYTANFGYEGYVGNKNSADTQYIDFSNSMITVHVGEAAPSETDYSALQTLYDNLKNKNVANATDATKTAFTDALANAKTILDAQTADQATVDAAKTALETADSNLKYKADYTELDALIVTADTKVQASYTAESWATFANALSAAKNLSRDLTTEDQNQINNAKTALSNAMAGLIPLTGANYQYLETAIATAENKIANESTWYTAATWSAFMTAYNAAKAVPAGLTSDQQAQINTATDNLNTAIGGLIEADADYTELSYKIGEAQTKVQADYTAESWSPFANALAAANAVPAGLKAKDQATIDTAKNNLVTAMGNLVALGGADYTALDAAIAKAPEFPQSYYTADSWSAYQTALNEANALSRSLKENEQYLVNAAEQKLTLAYNSLSVLGANYNGVNEAKGLVDTTDAETIRLYTVESLQAFANAVAAVDWTKKINEQADVDAMEAAIRAAAANLKYNAATTTPLTTAITRAAGYSAEYYTEDSYAALTNAVTAGQAILDRAELDIRNDAEIVAAANAIDNAIEALVALGADYKELTKAKEAFEALVEANYTVDSWAAAQSAYDAAVAVPAGLDKAQQATVDAAANALNDAINGLIELDADYTALTTAKTAAGKIKETTKVSGSDVANYTAESWAAFQAAYAAANAVPTGLKKSQQATVTDAAEALDAARIALVYAPFPYELNIKTITDLELNEDDYTAASWAAFQAAVNAIDWNLDMSKVSTGMQQYNALNKAYKALAEVGPADYTAVNNAKADAAALVEAEYTAASWAVLATALNAVVEGLNANHQTEVDAMAQAIVDAIAGLDKIVVEEKDADYTALNNALADAAALTESVYTVESWAVLAAAVAAGNQVPAGLKESEQATIDAAAKAITDAIAALEVYVEPNANYTALNNALAQAAAYSEDKYTAESWVVLADAVAAGNNVPADLKQSQQATIDAAAKAITDAIAALVKKPVEVKGSVFDVNSEPAKTIKNTFYVKVSDRAMMVQFVEMDHGNGTGTRSFDRYHDSVTIVSYNAAGEVVNSLSREVAYEIWAITTPLADGTIGVRVKNNGSSTWESMDLAYTFDNIRLVADSGVKSATMAESGPIGAVPVTIVAGPDAEIIQLRNSNGGTTTLKAEKATVVDGNLVFNAKAYIKVAGENVITIRTYYNGKWTTSDIVLTYTAR